MKIKNLLQALILFPIYLFSNPFLIDFPYKETLDFQDYTEIQTKLRSINLVELVEEYYPTDTSIAYSPKKSFKYRMSAGIRATLIDEKNGYYPEEIFEKIGSGGNNCVVSYASFNRGYDSLLKDIPAALKSTGFNGYFYARIGGYPNPTGIEAKYAAIPYSFKIFMILETFKKGFENVLWLDSSCLPQENCAPIFSIIKKNGCFFVGGRTSYENGWVGFYFPKAKQSLINLYGRNPLQEKQISASVFGLNKNDIRTHQFIQEYYRLLELGVPFASELPETFVYTSIAGFVDYPASHYIDPYSRELPNPVYAYTEQDHPELTAYERRGMILYRQNASVKVVLD